MENARFSPLSRRVIQLFWILPLGLYAATMARTVGYVDAALVLNNAYFLQIHAWVNNHNLFSIMGWLWIRILPLGSEFFRLNLLSMLCGAGTVYFIFLTCLSYTQRLWISAVAATALMLSQSLWWHSTMLEVYTLNSFLIALILLSVSRYVRSAQKRWFFAALFFWGLGVSNHILMALFFPAFLLLVIMDRRRLSLKDLALGLGFLVLGLSIFLFAFFEGLLKYGSLMTVLDQQTGGNFRSLMFADVPKLFWRLNYLFLLAYQYPSMVLVFLFYGAYLLVAKRQRFDLFLIAALIPQIIWSANYFVWDMYAFALPVYVLAAPVIARGLVLVADRRKLLLICSVSLLMPVFLYKNVQRIAPIRRIVGHYPDMEKVEAIFDPIEYFMDPDKSSFNAVDRFVKDLFEMLPENATFYDDVHDYPIHYNYQQIRRERIDINCPITWAIFGGEQDELRIADDIKRRISRGEPVYISKVVLMVIEPLLPDHNSREIRVYDQTIYQIKSSSAAPPKKGQRLKALSFIMPGRGLEPPRGNPH